MIILTPFGAVYIYILATRKFCQCPLCWGEYVLGEEIGSGGFSRVYKVKKVIADGEDQQYVLKRLEMTDITNID